jgi:uncharacterized protein (TIGR03083 family)
MTMSSERRDVLMGRFDSATKRLTEMLRAAPPERWGSQVAGLDWTVSDTAAHLATVFRRMTGDARRALDPSHLAELNDSGIAEVEGGLPAIADEIEARLAAIAERIPQIPADRVYPFHFGLQVPAMTGVAVVLGEVLVHGWEIGRAVDIELEIEPEDVMSFWRTGLDVLVGCVVPEAADVSEVWRIEMPGEEPVTLALDGGALTIDPDPAPAPDHVIEVTDPVRFMLGFPYGRVVLDAPADELVDRFAVV